MRKHLTRLAAAVFAVGALSAAAAPAVATIAASTGSGASLAMVYDGPHSNMVYD